MRVVALGTVIVLLAGLSLAAPSAAAQQPVTAALLTLEDLPEGWTQDANTAGDDSLAFRLSTTLDDLAFLETEMIVIRRSDVVSVLFVGSVGLFSPPESQTALLESLARLVDERLAAVVG